MYKPPFFFFLFSGFSLGQDDEDDDEREAYEDNIKILNLKEKKQENPNRRERRASHFYGHPTKRGDDAFDEKTGNMGQKIRPPKPR